MTFSYVLYKNETSKAVCRKTAARPTTGPHTPDSLTKHRTQYSENQPPPGYKCHAVKTYDTFSL